MKDGISRKDFLRIAAIGGLAMPGMSFLRSSSLSAGAKELIENIGVQLYTVRDILEKKTANGQKVNPAFNSIRLEPGMNHVEIVINSF